MIYTNDLLDEIYKKTPIDINIFHLLKNESEKLDLVLNHYYRIIKFLQLNISYDERTFTQEVLKSLTISLLEKLFEELKNNKDKIQEMFIETNEIKLEINGIYTSNIDSTVEFLSGFEFRCLYIVDSCNINL